MSKLEERRYTSRRREDCNIALINHRLDELVKVNKQQSEDMTALAKCGSQTRRIVDRYTHFFIAIIAISSVLFSFIGWAFIDLSLVINYLELLNASRS